MGGHIREDEMGRTGIKHCEMRNAYKILIRKPEEKRILGKSKRRWGIILKVFFKKCGVD
jgi:hypothetical protein